MNESENLAVDLDSVVPFEDLDANDELDRFFIDSFTISEKELIEKKWVQAVHDRYFGLGIPELVAVYLLRTTPAPPETDEWAWYVISPAGNAILHRQAGNHPLHALETYMEMMQTLAALADSDKEYAVGEEEMPAMDKERAALILETLDEIREVLSDEASDEEE
ncbi:MAG: hypothetical protein SGI88_00735 [Candidatus Hydrogenedentes bacterium]|nr:hypothetical protein [Candidatus Hydrogenedentota bacterium]